MPDRTSLNLKKQNLIRCQAPFSRVSIFPKSFNAWTTEAMLSTSMERRVARLCARAVGEASQHLASPKGSVVHLLGAY